MRCRDASYWHLADICDVGCRCPLSGVKRTWPQGAEMSLIDP